MQSSDRGVNIRSPLHVATAVAAAALVAGLGALLAYSLAETAMNPGLTIVDGYWIGRLPWMGIIEALVVGGATASVLFGTANVVARGGWLRRALVLLPAAAAAFWWFLAFIRAGVTGGVCTNCPPPPFDPWAYAYSAPELTFLTLILPAVAIAVLALATPARRPAGAIYISPS